MSNHSPPDREIPHTLNTSGSDSSASAPAAATQWHPPPVRGRLSLCILFFLHAAAMAAYAVPFPNVLDAHGLGAFAALALGTGGVAAFISPMMAGTLADRKVAPERLLAMMNFTSGTLLILVHCAVQFHWGSTVFLSLMMVYALSNAPGFSLVTSIVMSRLSDARREFGPIRVWGTIGWLAASLAVGVLFPFHSPASGYVGGGIFLAEAVFCLTLRPTPPPPGMPPRRLRDYFGWDALSLLRNPDHRLIFFTSALLSALLSTFYLYTVRHLRANGFGAPAVTMAFAQVFEALATFGLASVLLRFRIKWILAAALVLSILRFLLLMSGMNIAMIVSVCLHGPLYVFYYLTCQIYLEQRVGPGIRSQSQALLSLMNSGAGYLTGNIVIAWWYTACQQGDTVDWPRFWGVQAAAAALITVMFLAGYKGRKRI